MGSLSFISLAVTIAFAAGCGGDEPLTHASSAGSGAGGSGGGAPAGCQPGQLAIPSGGCRPAGVTDCGQGFQDDGDGCSAILPAMPCPKRQLAVPGDTACREISACGTQPWGDPPMAARTLFVDAMYVGGASDGSKSKPFVTIQEAVDSAADATVVAIAAGTYVEDVLVSGKSIRLWGRCASMVALEGTPTKTAALTLKGTGGAVVHAAHEPADRAARAI